MPSSRQKLELHLQVAVLLPGAIEAAPSAVADKEPAQAVCDRVAEELGRLIHLSRDLRDMVRERRMFKLFDAKDKRLRDREARLRVVVQLASMALLHRLEVVCLVRGVRHIRIFRQKVSGNALATLDCLRLIEQ